MTTIEPVTVLHGHTSPETAYLVEDYPYGRRLRCQIRYWLETAGKGAKKGQTRLMSQTTNPKKGDNWNKPKAGQYFPLLCMVREANGHIRARAVSRYGISPEDHAKLILEGVLDQIADTERMRYEWILTASRRWREPWDHWNTTIAALRDHQTTHGTLPDLHDRSHIGDLCIDEYAYPIACAWALSSRTEQL